MLSKIIIAIMFYSISANAARSCGQQLGQKPATKAELHSLMTPSDEKKLTPENWKRLDRNQKILLATRLSTVSPVEILENASMLKELGPANYKNIILTAAHAELERDTHRFNEIMPKFFDEVSRIKNEEFKIEIVQEILFNYHPIFQGATAQYENDILITHVLKMKLSQQSLLKLLEFPNGLAFRKQIFNQHLLSKESFLFYLRARFASLNDSKYVDDLLYLTNAIQHNPELTKADRNDFYKQTLLPFLKSIKQLSYGILSLISIASDESIEITTRTEIASSVARLYYWPGASKDIYNDKNLPNIISSFFTSLHSDQAVFNYITEIIELLGEQVQKGQMRHEHVSEIIDLLSIKSAIKSESLRYKLILLIAKKADSFLYPNAGLVQQKYIDSLAKYVVGEENLSSFNTRDFPVSNKIEFILTVLENNSEAELHSIRDFLTNFYLTKNEKIDIAIHFLDDHERFSNLTDFFNVDELKAVKQSVADAVPAYAQAIELDEAILALKRSGKYGNESIEIAWDYVKKRETGEYFLKYLEIKRLQKIRFRDSIDLVKTLTQSSLTRTQLLSYSRDTLGTFYEIVVQLLKNGSSADILSKLSRDMFDKDNIKNTIELLVFYNSHYSAKMDLDDPDGKNPATKCLEKFDRITPKNYKELTDLIKFQLVAAVQSLFAEFRFQISADQLEELRKQWGDLNPIFVLVSRLKTMSRSEVGIVAKILDSSLKGNFKSFKFDGGRWEYAGMAGSGTAQKQLKMLSETQREIWEQPQVIVKLAGVAVEGASIAARRTSDAKNIIDTNLKPHWKMLLEENQIGNLKQLSSAKREKLMEELLNYVGDPRLLFEKLQIEKNENKLQSLQILIESLETFVTSPAEAKLILSLVRAGLGKIEIQNPNQILQIQDDLKAIAMTLFPKAEASINTSHLIATAKSSDAKLLLTVGDCVSTSSCQNYRTGSVIRTLPGYVIDANVQVVVSYDLTTSSFSNSKEYQTVESWIADDPDSVQVSFDGNLKVFRFENSGVVIQTKALDKAFLRNILKVGSMGDGSPGLVYERDYSQTNQYLQQMQSQHRELLNRMAEEMGASTVGVMTIEASRNPEGHYSDLKGGVQKDSYKIEVH